MIRYIFSINPSRAGSQYLCQLFRHANNVASFHEPWPQMANTPMVEYNKGRQDSLRRLMPRKIKSIKDLIFLEKKSIYVETNAHFITGFGWLLPKYLSEEEIGVVILRRKVDDIVKSCLRLNFTPKKNGYLYMFHPDEPTNVTKPPKFKHDEAMIRWHIREVYAKGEVYKRKFPKIKYYNTRTEDLNNINNVVKMFTFFNLSPAKDLKNVVGVPVNYSKKVNGKWKKMEWCK